MQDNNAFEGILNFDSDDKKIDMRGKNKPTKQEFFEKEQNEILKKINNILGISKDNNKIYLYDIENDKDKREKILALSPEVRKAFKCGSWGFFREELCKDNHVLLCKSIYKAMGYQILSKQTDIIRENQKIKTMQYIIGKINITM